MITEPDKSQHPQLARWGPRRSCWCCFSLEAGGLKAQKGWMFPRLKKGKTDAPAERPAEEGNSLLLAGGSTV